MSFNLISDNKISNLYSKESCKYSVNIGWQGGVYAQMCGHYLHFDCYSSYRQALNEKIHAQRINQIDFSCPLCRQTANCVLPLSTNLQTKTNEANKKDSDVAVSSTISNVPAKIWILSSLADKMNMTEENKTKNETISSSNKDVYEKLLAMLKFRSFLGANTVIFNYRNALPPNAAFIFRILDFNAAFNPLFFQIRCD